MRSHSRPAFHTKRHHRTNHFRPRHELLEERHLLAKFVVTTTVDGGPGSLRQALDDAALAPGPDTVEINVPGNGAPLFRSTQRSPFGTPIPFTVFADTTLTGVFNANTLTPVAQIDAEVVIHSKSTVRGISFAGDNAQTTILGSEVTFEGNWVGLGINPSVTGGAGLQVDGNNNKIGERGFITFFTQGVGEADTLLPKGNVISGNFGGSFNRAKSLAIDGDNNRAVANKVGTSPDGKLVVPNAGHFLVRAAVHVHGNGNSIGGSAAGLPNIIAGSSGAGISVIGERNFIVGNHIGTGPIGNEVVDEFGTSYGNKTGIFVSSGDQNTAIISNLVVNSVEDGIQITGNSEGQSIRGNMIGLSTPDRDGLRLPLGNGRDGISLISDGAIVDDNTIAASGDNGIRIQGASHRITNNRIGTDPDGQVIFATENPLADDGFGNGNDGILLSGVTADDNTIGAVGAGNVIGGNGRHGISLNGTGLANTVIQSNSIGVSADGTKQLANSGNGIHVGTGPGGLPKEIFTQIGGQIESEGNHIAFNVREGIFVDGSGRGETGVMGNSIHDNGTPLGLRQYEIFPLGETLVGTRFIEDGARFVAEVENFQVRESGGLSTISGRLNELTPEVDYRIEAKELVGAERTLGVTQAKADIIGNAFFAITSLVGGVSDEDIAIEVVPRVDLDSDTVQNAPTIVTVTTGEGGTTIAGTLRSRPDALYRIEAFDQLGRKFLGATTITSAGPLDDELFALLDDFDDDLDFEDDDLDDSDLEDPDSGETDPSDPEEGDSEGDPDDPEDLDDEPDVDSDLLPDAGLVTPFEINLSSQVSDPSQVVVTATRLAELEAIELEGELETVPLVRLNTSEFARFVPAGDLTIRGAYEKNEFAGGEGVFQQSADGNQVETITLPAGEIHQFFVDVVNSGNQPTSFFVQALGFPIDEGEPGEPEDQGWTARYFSNLVEITDDITDLDLSFETPTLAPGAKHTISVELQADPNLVKVGSAGFETEISIVATELINDDLEADVAIDSVKAIARPGLIVTEVNDLEEPEQDRDDRVPDADPNKPGQQTTLRAAITYANEMPGPNVIHFDLAGIRPSIKIDSANLGPLPAVVDALEIEGTNLADAGEKIILSGSNLNTAEYGLRANGESADRANDEKLTVEFRNLVINNFGSHGIVLDDVDEAKINDNIIGLNADLSPQPNGGDGIRINNTSEQSLHSGAIDIVVESNTIGSNKRNGIHLEGPQTADPFEVDNDDGQFDDIQFNVKLTDNLVGVTTGDNKAQKRGNEFSGIRVDNYPGVQIGNGGSDQPGNVISANGVEQPGGAISGGTGISILGANSFDIVIQGNHIGTERSNKTPLGNLTGGIEVFKGAHEILIGGVILPRPGSVALDFGRAPGNVIAANGVQAEQHAGIRIIGDSDPETRTEENTRNVVVQGNLIGSETSAALGNAGPGVVVNGAEGNKIGDIAVEGDSDDLLFRGGNLISQNGSHGVHLINNALGNDILGNVIGLDAELKKNRGNLGDGVRLASGAQLNRIGFFPLERVAANPETPPEFMSQGNQIFGNFGAGVRITGKETQSNEVQANNIGIFPAPLEEDLISNGESAVILENGANDNLIGGFGSSQDHRDVSFKAGQFEGNTLGSSFGQGTLVVHHGVLITTGAEDNTISGNLIRGSSGNGIHIRGGKDNGIGQDFITSERFEKTFTTGNLIEGNDGAAILLFSSEDTAPTRGNDFEFNRILTTGVELRGRQTERNTFFENVINFFGEPNEVAPAPAILIEDALFNTFGGRSLNASGARPNEIASFSEGVVVTGTSAETVALNNGILANDFGNVPFQFIDLNDDGVTPNDITDDRDTGPNRLQNFPNVLSANVSELIFDGDGAKRQLVVDALLDTQPNTFFLVQFYSVQRDSATYLGERIVKTNEFGIVPGHTPGTSVFRSLLSVSSIDVDPTRDRIAATASMFVANGQEVFLETSEMSPSVELGTDLTDEDLDSIPDQIEEIGPNNGDANENGIPDAVEPQVAVVPQNFNTVPTFREGPEILAGQLLDVFEVLGEGNRINKVLFGNEQDFKVSVPRDQAQPVLNLMNFQIEAPNGFANIQIKLPKGVFANRFLKFDKDGNPFFFDFDPRSFTGARFSVDEQGNRILNLHIDDGGRGDRDGVVNGVIEDPGVPVLSQALTLNLQGTDFSQLVLRRSGESLEIADRRNDVVLASRPLAATRAVIVQGSDTNDDKLTIDFESGGEFSLIDGLDFDGGIGGFDTLEIIGGGTATEERVGEKSGTISLDEMIIRYSDVETDAATDNELDANTIDELYAAIATGSANSTLDFDNNGRLDQNDVDSLVRTELQTQYGDTNLDGNVDFADFLTFSQNFGGSGTWSDGDFDGDGLVSFADFLLLTANFGFRRGV